MQDNHPIAQLQETFLQMIDDGSLVDVRHASSEFDTDAKELTLTFVDNNYNDGDLRKIEQTANHLDSDKPVKSLDLNYIFTPDPLGFSTIRMWPRHDETGTLVNTLQSALNKKIKADPYTGVLRGKFRIAGQKMDLLNNILMDNHEAWSLEDAIERLQEHVYERMTPQKYIMIENAFMTVGKHLDYLRSFRSAAPTEEQKELIDSIEDFYIDIGRHLNAQGFDQSKSTTNER